MQYIHVKLLNGFPQPLTYKVPAGWPNDLIGTIVKVPLKDRFCSAYVFAQEQELAQKPSFAIKEAHSCEPMPNDPNYKKFIEQLSYYYQVDRLHFIKRIRNFVSQEAEESISFSSQENVRPQAVQLTDEQNQIVQTLSPALQEQKFRPALIHGVTGSGKTEIYKELIKKAFLEGKTTLLLLPEVSLALRFEKILKAALPEYPIIGFHSGTKAKEKRQLWQSLLDHKPILIVGVHIPILLPIGNLGLIIIDEEHEVGYQEKKHPKINTKEAALMRAQLNKIPIILGSATPSIATLHTAKTKNWDFFSLQKRFAGSFPTITTVLLDNKDRRSNFWITKELQKAIADRLTKKEQTIIFLNRRGYSFFVQCKDCSFVFECKSCSVSLTLHNNNELTCHYCGYSQSLPETCSACKTKNLIKKGIGTQQVVTILQQLFPSARIGRADLDVSSKKKEWQATMDAFDQGSIDILVGTQTITKGFHFPRVTLVGILWADLNLHFPLYNAGETTLQQLIQVAGRAGRESSSSMVIVQTMMKHPIFDYLNEIDYLKFYDYELKNRTMVKYPPFIRFVEIELKHTHETIIEDEAHKLMNQLVDIIFKTKKDITILGPAKPPVSKIKNTHSRKIYLKSSSISDLIELFRSFNKTNYKSHIFFTPNPGN